MFQNSSEKKVVKSIAIFTLALLILLNVKIEFNECGRPEQSHSKEDVKINIKNELTNEDRNILNIEKKIRKEIQDEMETVHNREDKFRKRLKDFIPADGGRPKRSLIVTTWRSGSSFVSGIVNSVPGSFLFYQPAVDYYVHQLSAPPQSDRIKRRLHGFLNCDFQQYFSEVNSMKRLTSLIQMNAVWGHSSTRFWQHCRVNPDCWSQKFFASACSLYPHQVMKITAIRLEILREFLENESYGVKILLLVRDPRGTLLSRNATDWCLEAYPDCSNPAFLCSNLLADYATAVRFSKEYPKTFKVIKFEDLTSDIFAQSKKIFEFFGLPLNNLTDEFLNKNTKKDQREDLYSLERNTKDVATRWARVADFGFVERVQDGCGAGMKAWGYKRVESEGEMRAFKYYGGK